MGGRGRLGPAADRLDVEGRAVIPGFVDSHSHLVSYGTGPPSSGPARGAPVHGGRDPPHGRLHQSRADDAALRTRAGALVGMLAQGTTTVEIKSGYASLSPTRRGLLRIAAELTRETTSSAPTWSLAGPPTTPTAMSTLSSAMLTACPAREVDRRLREDGAFTVDHQRIPPRALPGLGLRATRPSSAPPTRCGSPCRWAPSVDHCPPAPRGHGRAAGSDTVDPAAGAEFSTGQDFPGPALLDGAEAIATDCNPGRPTPPRCRCASPSPSADGDDPVRGAARGDPRGARALRRPDVGRLVPAPAPTSSCRRPPSTSRTGPASARAPRPRRGQPAPRP